MRGLYLHASGVFSFFLGLFLKMLFVLLFVFFVVVHVSVYFVILLVVGGWVFWVPFSLAFSG